jgi:hypothetical protein
MRMFWVFAIAMLANTLALHAQDNKYQNDAGGLGCGLYGSGGIGHGSAGGYIMVYETSRFPKLWPGGVLVDAGVTGPIAGRPIDGTLSVNYQAMFNPKSKGHQREKLVFPFVTAGYTRFVVTGNAANYGAGVNWWIRETPKGDIEGLRFEYREAYIAGVGRRPEFRVSYAFMIGGEL